MINPPEEGSATVEKKASDDPDSSQGLDTSASLEGDKPASHFDLQILDRTRRNCARLLPNTGASSLSRRQEKLGEWSEAMRLLMGPLPEDRLRLAEFMTPRLHAAVGLYPAEVWTREKLLLKTATEVSTPGSEFVVCSIDGLVDEPFWEQTVGLNGTARQAVNIDHHQGATADTPSSCIQLLKYLMRKFEAKLATGDNRPLELLLLANDPDQDVSACVGLAKHLPFILSLPEEDLRLFSEYLSVQDLLDRHAAMVPINPDSPHLGWNAHINQPYIEARRQSLFNLPTDPRPEDRNLAASVMRAVIQDVSGRFGNFAKGDRSTRSISTNIHPLYESVDWCLIDESDPVNGELSGVGAISRGKQFLAKVRPAGNRFIYSFNHADPKFLGNSQAPIKLDLPVFLRRLEALDPQAKYGGSKRCGGCRAGSTLHPDQMVANIERCLQEQSLDVGF